MIGTTLSHYRIIQRIGAGGMGEVYLAHDEHLQRDVAVKVLPSGTLTDDAVRSRFRKEALTLSKLNHPNIATVFDFDTQDRIDFLVMEYVSGQTLDRKLAEGPLSEKEVSDLGVQLAEGLAAAHEKGVVHRDLKPANLIVTQDGRLKILDFGLAKYLEPTSQAGATTESATGCVPGTLPYMSPEQLRSERIDARTDIHAAGMIIYEMATGRRPFCEDTAPRLIDAILHQAATPPRKVNSRLSPELERLTLRCLEKHPEDRYQSAKELSVDLGRLCAPLSLPAGKPSAMWRPRWLLFAAAGVLVVAVLLVALFGLNARGWRERLLGTTPLQTIRSLAVLPLENLSRDPAQEYFADGMTEALIADLSKIGALRVISRTSVLQYKTARKPLPEIARALDVDAIVEGSVLRAGDRVRITAQLIATRPERHLWANSYDRELRDVLAVHSEVAQVIAREIRIAVSPEEKVRLGKARRVDPEAYDDYLKGRDQSSRWGGGSFRKGMEFFQSAIKKDPGFAPAYAALSDSYAGLSYWGYIPPRQAYPLAKAAASRAMELDDSLAQAHFAMANVHWYYEWDVAAAERELERALALDPSHPNSHLRRAAFLATVRGNRPGALAEISRVRELDPASMAVPAKIMTGWVFFFVHEFDRAMDQAHEALAIDPGFPQVYYLLGLTAIGRGRPADAIQSMERAVALSRDSNSLAYLASACALAGQQARAQALLSEMKEMAKREYVPPMRFAWVSASTGDVEDALKWLEKSYEDRDAMLWWLKVIPLFDPLRSNPRFQDLLRRMNFPE
jgi:eukaryotic-like serine/threonine-protein kinase